MLPGKIGDEFCIKIFHVPFLEPDIVGTKPSPRLSFRGIEQTVPDGWMIRETIEGRHLFISTNNLNVTTWTHPDPDIETEQYRGYPKDVDDYSPQYEALSYAWGKDAAIHRAYVYDENSPTKSSKRYLQIRPNLESALQYLRYPDRSRMLWIDAICINQGDVLETEAQVKRMREIYQRASRVVLWLGPEQDSSSLAIRTLRHLGLQAEHSVDRWWASPDATEIGWGDPQTPLPYSDDTWTALGNLLSRSYFQRVWIVQEARLARQGIVHCGSDSLPWNLFRRAVITLREKTTKPKDMINIYNGVRALCNSRFQSDFFKLMTMSRSRECADPRDKLYGVLSLASPLIAQGIKPQYNQDVAEVYKDAAVLYFGICSRLDLLSQCSRATEFTKSPSWIPNWSQEASNFLQTTYFSPAAGISCASYQVKAPGELQVIGVRSDIVAGVERVLRGENETIFDIWQQPGLQKDNQSPDTLLTPFLDLIFINSIRERYPTNRSYISLEESRKRYLSERSIPLELWPEVRVGNFRNMSFITTSNGLLGLAPTDTALGKSTNSLCLLTNLTNFLIDDLICVLLGCHMPMILRPTFTGEGFKIIGPCLIHGLMDAEALLGPLPKPWIVEFYRDNLGYARLHFRNTETKDLTVEDPRLGPLTPEWERFDQDRTLDDPRWFAYYRNKATGEIMNSDPRMLPEELKKRNVNLEMFCLV